MADECSFETIHTENLGYCPNEETVGGVQTEAFYIPMAQLTTFTKPTITPASTYEERMTIEATGIVPAATKGFKKITLMADESELKNTLVGNKGNKKAQVSLDALIPNFTAKNLGFVETHKNTPLLFIIPDSTGVLWAIPYAYIDKGDGTTGKKYEDNSGISVTLTANSKIYRYLGTVTVTEDSEG